MVLSSPGCLLFLSVQGWLSGLHQTALITAQLLEAGLLKAHGADGAKTAVHAATVCIGKLHR